MGIIIVILLLVIIVAIPGGLGVLGGLIGLCLRLGIFILILAVAGIGLAVVFG